MKKKGKGLSFDQKRQKMLSIFHKTKGVFNYQEIQKQSTKVGIPFPSVKQVLQSLKADSLVQCQKIGAGVFYWSFPSRAHQIMNQHLSSTQKQFQTFTEQISTLQSQLEHQKIGRQQNPTREALTSQLSQLTSQCSYLQQKISELIRFNPQRYELLVKENGEIKAAINGEIDNLEQIKKYIKRNCVGISDKEIEEGYGIGQLDYVE